MKTQIYDRKNSDYDVPINLLESMLKLYSPSGHEEKIARFIMKRMGNLGFENIRKDIVGNV